MSQIEIYILNYFLFRIHFRRNFLTHKNCRFQFFIHISK